MLVGQVENRYSCVFCCYSMVRSVRSAVVRK